MNILGSEINFELNSDELKIVDLLLRPLHPLKDETLKCEILKCNESCLIRDVRCVKINDKITYVCKYCYLSFQYIKKFDNKYNFNKKIKKLIYISPVGICDGNICYRCTYMDDCNKYVYSPTGVYIDEDGMKWYSIWFRQLFKSDSCMDQFLEENKCSGDNFGIKYEKLNLCKQCEETLHLNSLS